MAIVTEYVRNLIAKQVEDNGLVVWYDPDNTYTDAVEVLELPNTTVLRYDGNVNRKLTICDNRILTTPERCLKFEMTRVNHLTLSLSGRA